MIIRLIKVFLRKEQKLHPNFIKKKLETLNFYNEIHISSDYFVYTVTLLYHSTVQYNTVQYSTVQYSTVKGFKNKLLVMILQKIIKIPFEV